MADWAHRNPEGWGSKAGTGPKGIRHEVAQRLKKLINDTYASVAGTGESGRGMQAYFAKKAELTLPQVLEMTSEADGTPWNPDRIGKVLRILHEDIHPQGAARDLFQKLCDLLEGVVDPDGKHVNLSFRERKPAGVPGINLPDDDFVPPRFSSRRVASASVQEDNTARQLRAYYDETGRHIVTPLVNALLDCLAPEDVRGWAAQHGIPMDSLILLRQGRAATYPADCVEGLIQALNPLAREGSAAAEALEILTEMHRTLTGQSHERPELCDLNMRLGGILSQMEQAAKARW